MTDNNNNLNKNDFQNYSNHFETHVVDVNNHENRSESKSDSDIPENGVRKSSSAKTIVLSTLLSTLAILIEANTSNTSVVSNSSNVIDKPSTNTVDEQKAEEMDPSQLPLNTIHSNISNGSSVICRICHNNENIDRLISPCLCKGSLAYVHKYCVEYWLSRSGILHCELCMHPYNTRNTLRYSFLESLRIWYRHPNNRGLLHTDLLTCVLLTIVSLGLIAMSLLSLHYFMIQGPRIGLSRFWTQSSIIMFLCIVLFAYSINLFFIIRGQILPWFRWWRSARQVHLILETV